MADDDSSVRAPSLANAAVTPHRRSKGIRKTLELGGSRGSDFYYFLIIVRGALAASSCHKIASKRMGIVRKNNDCGKICHAERDNVHNKFYNILPNCKNVDGIGKRARSWHGTHEKWSES
jgi:hypothetical protein